MWKFKIPKAPWLGDKFEWLITLIKASFYSTIGKAQLTWAELGEVLPNIEVTLNNRPLGNIEEDYPILTSNILILGCGVNFPNNAVKTMYKSFMEKMETCASKRPQRKTHPETQRQNVQNKCRSRCGD